MLPHALWKCKGSKFLEDRAETQLEASDQRTSGLYKSSWNQKCCWASSQAGPNRGWEGTPTEFTGTFPAQRQSEERWLLLWDREGKCLPPRGTQGQSLKAPQSRSWSCLTHPQGLHTSQLKRTKENKITVFLPCTQLARSPLSTLACQG